MKTVTNTFIRTKECKHSVVFKPVNVSRPEDEIASSVYINRTVLPSDAKYCNITISFPEGGTAAVRTDPTPPEQHFA